MSATDIKTAFFIAYKTITRGHKSTVALIVFILSLSFFNLMFVSGFLNGFSDGIMRSMIDNSTAHIIVMPQEEPTRKEFILDQEKVRADIQTIPGVVASTRHYQVGGSFAYDKEKNGKFKYVSAPIVGVNQMEEKKVLSVYKNMVSGEFPNDLKDDEIVMGANLTGGFGTKQTNDLGGALVGDKVQVTYSNGIARTYTISGIFKITMGSVSNTAFISASEAESVLSSHNNASEILVRVNLIQNTLDEYADRIAGMFPNLRIEKYTARLSTVGILVAAFDIIALIVSVISIIVAAITIFVMIYVNAVSKRRQIGILKAIGIKESIIETSYIIQSLFYASLGTIAGLMIIFWITVPFLAVKQIQMPFGEATLVYTSAGIGINIASLIVSGIFAGFIPAKIVAREDILKSIWG
ncbi:MAG: FtsX-like permease family protein [Rectinemataceae bacterium]|nr:FtsX-like permease family protein [Rectinemataceae bacterium]